MPPDDVNEQHGEAESLGEDAAMDTAADASSGGSGTLLGHPNLSFTERIQRSISHMSDVESQRQPGGGGFFARAKSADGEHPHLELVEGERRRLAPLVRHSRDPQRDARRSETADTANFGDASDSPQEMPQFGGRFGEDAINIDEVDGASSAAVKKRPMSPLTSGRLVPVGTSHKRPVLQEGVGAAAAMLDQMRVPSNFRVKASIELQEGQDPADMQVTLLKAIHELRSSLRSDWEAFARTFTDMIEEAAKSSRESAEVAQGGQRRTATESGGQLLSFAGSGSRFVDMPDDGQGGLDVSIESIVEEARSSQGEAAGRVQRSTASQASKRPLVKVGKRRVNAAFYESGHSSRTDPGSVGAMATGASHLERMVSGTQDTYKRDSFGHGCRGGGEDARSDRTSKHLLRGMTTPNLKEHSQEGAPVKHTRKNNRMKTTKLNLKAAASYQSGLLDSIIFSPGMHEVNEPGDRGIGHRGQADTGLASRQLSPQEKELDFVPQRSDGFVSNLMEATGRFRPKHFEPQCSTQSSGGVSFNAEPPEDKAMDQWDAASNSSLVSGPMLGRDAARSTDLPCSVGHDEGGFSSFNRPGSQANSFGRGQQDCDRGLRSDNILPAAMVPSQESLPSIRYVAPTQDSLPSGRFHGLQKQQSYMTDSSSFERGGFAMLKGSADAGSPRHVASKKPSFEDSALKSEHVPPRLGQLKRVGTLSMDDMFNAQADAIISQELGIRVPSGGDEDANAEPNESSQAFMLQTMAENDLDDMLNADIDGIQDVIRSRGSNGKLDPGVSSMWSRKVSCMDELRELREQELLEETMNCSDPSDDEDEENTKCFQRMKNMPGSVLAAFGILPMATRKMRRKCYARLVLGCHALTCIYLASLALYTPQGLYIRVADVVFAAGSLLSLTALRFQGLGRLLGPEAKPLELYAVKYGFLQAWVKCSSRSLALAVFTWLVIMAMPVAIFDYLEFENFHAGTEFLPSADSTGAVTPPLLVFGFSTSLYCMLCFTVLHICQGLELMVDGFCIRFFEDVDFSRGIAEWNAMQAILRRFAHAVDVCFITLSTSVGAAVMTTCADVLTAPKEMEGLLSPGMARFAMWVPHALLLVWTLFRAAAVTEKCERTPALVNSLILDSMDTINHDRQYMVAYIEHSAAGFYVQGVRLTASLVLKVCYFAVFATFTFLAQSGTMGIKGGTMAAL
eukprot:TRINITY_DN37957_c0_g1_i2.p1 TRINITY_DN37957_c0_g1~~TRINITY_DN37957_c0_g1_i2.p1  ORF type:complete len:1190 (-),score=272.66 TRINITY_DN37957_c0_g1_i2:276-3845(-)